MYRRGDAIAHKLGDHHVINLATSPPPRIPTDAANPRCPAARAVSIVAEQPRPGYRGGAVAQYWLLDWLDEEGADSLRAAKRALSTNAGFKRLLARAEQVSNEETGAIDEARGQIIAGSGLDLSGALDCSESECMKKRVSDVLYRTWHYFDTVVVTGLDADELPGLIQNGWPRDEVVKAAMNHIDVALHVRKTGAEKALTFAQKPYYCMKHIDHHAREAGMIGVRKRMRDFRKALKSSGKLIGWRQNDGGVFCDVSHPALDIISVNLYHVQFPPNQEEILDQWSDNYASQYIATLVRDTAFARRNGAALGLRAAIDGALIPTRRGRPTVSDVAFNLQLPIVEHLPIKELLSIREHEAADFHAFRSALSRAVEARLASMPTADSDQIAESVIDDLLEPALQQIDRKLIRATELLARRSVASAALGVALATVGLLAFAPVAVPGMNHWSRGIFSQPRRLFKGSEGYQTERYVLPLAAS